MDKELMEKGIYVFNQDELKGLAKELVHPAENELHLEAARAGVLSDFAETKVMGVPVGAAAAGLLTVSVWDAIRGLVGGALPAQIPQWLIPAVGAVVVQSKMVEGWMGTDASNAAGLILTADAIQALFNVRGIVSGLVGRIKLHQTMRGTVATGGNGHREIASIEEYNLVHGLA